MSYKDSIKKVPGRKNISVFMFTLSTCIWCKKTKQLFKELGVEYEYVDVDLLEGKDKDEASKAMAKWNPDTSFPTIIINNKKTIFGFDEQAIRDVCDGK